MKDRNYSMTQQDLHSRRTQQRHDSPYRAEKALVMLITCTLLLCFLVAPVLSISGASIGTGITVKPVCTKPDVGFGWTVSYEDEGCGTNWMKEFTPVTFQFLGSSRYDNVDTWLWNFGDGTTATGKNPVHTFTSASDVTNTVIVTGTNSCGSGTASTPVYTFGPATAKIALHTSPSDAYTGSVWKVDANTYNGNQYATTPAGSTVMITINKDGYQPFSKSFTAIGGKNICIEANLVPATTTQTTTTAQTTTASGTTYVPPVTNPTNNPTQAVGQSGSAGSLYITSTPSGAAVFMNGDAKGTTPATLTGIVPGTYTVLLKKSGYPDYTTSTAIIAGQVTTINADLAKGPQAATTNAPAAAATTAPVPGEGSLSVSTTPQGAQVFIDGVVRGMTPATIPGLSAGQHTILLKMDGYQEFNTTVSIPDGKTAEFNTALAKTPKSPGFTGVLAVLGLAGICLLRKRGE